MKYHEFLGAVQNRARLDSDSAAVGAVRATLETLGERLAGGQAEHVAAQLPAELGYYLEQPNNDESFELDDFYRRVAEREAVDYPDAVYHAKVVMGVLSDAIAPGEMRDLRAQLPDEFNDLFEIDGGGPRNN